MITKWKLNIQHSSSPFINAILFVTGNLICSWAGIVKYRTAMLLTDFRCSTSNEMIIKKGMRTHGMKFDTKQILFSLPSAGISILRSVCIHAYPSLLLCLFLSLFFFWENVVPGDFKGIELKNILNFFRWGLIKNLKI
jgi:hypothetical protein